MVFRGPSPAHAGGRVTPDRGLLPHIHHLRARDSRDRWRCLAIPTGHGGETPLRASFSSWPLQARVETPAQGVDPRFHQPGEPRDGPIRRSQLAVSGGTELLGGTLVVPWGRRHLSDAIGFSQRPGVVVYPTLGCYLFISSARPPS